MSQQIINISTPDDGLGDVLRNGFDKTNQNFTELYNGKVDKITGKGLSENDFTDADKSKLDGIESGAEVNVQADWGETDPLSDSFIQNKPPALYSAFGYFHVSDLATQTTPLAFVASTPLKLTNDNAGTFTSEAQAPYGVPKIWNTSTNSLDFTHLSVGDSVLVRTDLLISTTSINQNLRLYIKFGVGTPSEYDLLIDSWNEKSVVTFEQFIKDVSFSIDNEDWRDAPAKIYILSDDNGQVKVNGWYTPIIRKSVNVIDFNSDPLKLDKVSTAGVERAYIINADGSQGTKATSYFKDVLEFTNLASFPVTGETGKIYVALDTNFTYRWSGSAYVQVGGGGKFEYRNVNSYNHTGTTAATLLFQTTIPANTINNGSLIEFIVNAYRVSGTSNNIFTRIYASNTNNFATATQIATTSISTSSGYNKLRREAECYGGNFHFVLAGTNATPVDYSTFTSPTAYPFDFTQPIFIFFAMLNQSATDVSMIKGAYIFLK